MGAAHAVISFHLTYPPFIPSKYGLISDSSLPLPYILQVACVNRLDTKITKSILN